MATNPKDLPPDDSRGYEIIVVQTVFFTIALGLVALRLYVRKYIVRALGWDDLSMVLALLVAIILFVFCILLVQNGLGRHVFYLSATNITQATKYFLIGQALIVIGAACSRISITLFLVRVLVVQNKWRITLQCFAGFIAISCIADFVQFFFNCKPLEAAWTLGETGTCWPKYVEVDIHVFYGSLAVVLDFILAILPIVFLWDVKISRKRKVGICCLMGLGVVTGAITIVRTYEQFVDIPVSKDPTWDSVDVTIWGSLEELFLIIGGTIPTIQPIFHLQRRKRDYYVTDYGGNGSGNVALKGSRSTRAFDRSGLSTMTTQKTEPRRLHDTGTESEDHLYPERIELSALDRGGEQAW